MEWRDFVSAAHSNDTNAIISGATPAFVSDQSDCLRQFCFFNCKFDGDAVVIPHLLAMGADFPTEGFHGTVDTQRFNLAKVLLAIGCDPNATIYNNTFGTPLDRCARRTIRERNWDIIHLLIDAGGELHNEQDQSIQSIIDFRKAARMSAIAIIGVGETKGKKDVFRIIARSIWSQRIK